MMEDPKESEAQAPEVTPAAGALPPPVASSPFDPLFVTPEEARKIEAEKQANPTPAEVPQEEVPEEPERLLAEEVDRICKAVDRLSRKGLNLRAVVALLHDANPSIPKKHIKAILDGLRELPAIYGKAPLK